MRFLLIIIIALLVGIWTSSALWAVVTMLLLMVLWLACVMLGMLFITIGLACAAEAQYKVWSRKG